MIGTHKYFKEKTLEDKLKKSMENNFIFAIVSFKYIIAKVNIILIFTNLKFFKNFIKGVSVKVHVYVNYSQVAQSFLYLNKKNKMYEVVIFY